MSDTANKPDILAKYRKSGRGALIIAGADKPTSRVPQPYTPYQLSKDAKRHIEVRVKFPDPAQCPLNSMITNVIGEWRKGLRIGLYFGTSMVIDIEGRNLQELFQAVKDWKVDWLEEFDARFHVQPTDEDAPFIKSITIHTKRPDAPPMSERH